MARGDRIRHPMAAEEVKAAREVLGMTQEQLADALELESKFSRDTIRAWESGKRVVPGPPGVAIRLMLELNKRKHRKKLTIAS